MTATTTPIFRINYWSKQVTYRINSYSSVETPMQIVSWKTWWIQEKFRYMIESMTSKYWQFMVVVGSVLSFPDSYIVYLMYYIFISRLVSNSEWCMIIQSLTNMRCSLMEWWWGKNVFVSTKERTESCVQHMTFVIKRLNHIFFENHGYIPITVDNRQEASKL